MVPLSTLIASVLSEGLEGHFSVADISGDVLCEWRPLRKLLMFSRSLSCADTHCMFGIEETPTLADSSFSNTVSETKMLLSNEGIQLGIVQAFSSAMLCTTLDGILENFPSVVTLSQGLLGVPFSLLSSVIFLEQSLLARVYKLWPEIFFSGLEKTVSTMHSEKENDASGNHAHAFSAEEMLVDGDLDATESAARAFSFLLKETPFHVLFPAIMLVDSTYLSESSNIEDLLLAKLSEWSSESLIPSLRLILFWHYQIQSLHHIKPEPRLQPLSKICLSLVNHLFLKLNSHISTKKAYYFPEQITQEAVKIVLCHPAVLTSLSGPSTCNGELTNENLGLSLEAFLRLCQQRVHRIDNDILDILKTTLEYLLTGELLILKEENDKSKSLVKAFDALMRRFLSDIRKQFQLCIGSEDVSNLLPGFYSLQMLIRSISPFELLELVHWMFTRVDIKKLPSCQSSYLSAIFVAFCIAGDAFEAVSAYLQQTDLKRVPFDLLWNTKEKAFDVNLVEEVYFDICKFATTFGYDFMDNCLLKAVHATYRQLCMQQHNVHPLSCVMARVAVRTPVEIFSHCMEKTNMTKAKLISLLVKMCPMHLSGFGKFLLGTVNADTFSKRNQMANGRYTLSDEDLLMLLPAALSYMNSMFLTFGKEYWEHFTNIPSFYSRILFNGFQHWRSYVSGYMFQEEFGEFIPSSNEELLNLVQGSLLGKAVVMLQCHFALGGKSLKTKKLVKLFNSICSSTGTNDELLDCDVTEMKFYSVNQWLNLLNKVVAKISLCRMLLFPEDSDVESFSTEATSDSKVVPLELGSDELYPSRMQLMNLIVGTWQWVIKKIPSKSDGPRQKMRSSSLRLYKFLEAYLLRNIFELTERMLDNLIQLQSISFLEQLIRSCLLYRFEDPITLQTLRSILHLLSGEKFSSLLYLQLLLAHSQFAPAIQSVRISSKTGTGVLLRPMTSILRWLVIPHSNTNNVGGEHQAETTASCIKQLEILKLLRIVFPGRAYLRGSEFEGDCGINLRELYLLLLSSYSATLSDVDLEIYSLMHEIELIDKTENEITQFDNLWGGATLKIRKELDLEQHTSSNNMSHTEVVKEQLRNLFRENLPIDPKTCAMTVLYFPYDRCVGPLPSSFKVQTDDIKNKCEVCLFYV